MQEALTSGACEINISYETLELLGDSILNFAGGTYVFMEHPCFNREQLHLTRYKLVCNKALHQFALLRGLTPYVFAELWNPRLWVPPGPGMGNHGSQEGLVRVTKTSAAAEMMCSIPHVVTWLHRSTLLNFLLLGSTEQTTV